MALAVQPEAFINDVVEREVGKGGVSPLELARRIEEETHEYGEGVEQEVASYVAALRSLNRQEAQTVIHPLSDGVGGQWDGTQIEIAARTVQVERGGLEETIARMRGVGEHEALHARGGHHLIEGPETVRVGEVTLTKEEAIEGYVVGKTDDRFVSPDYKRYKSNVQRAIATSRRVTLKDFERALNEKHNLWLIDESRSTEEMGENLRKAA